MLDQGTREAILQLAGRGHSARRIGKHLGVSRASVREVIASGQAQVPRLDRAEKAEPHRDQILELFGRCNGNLVRVHEELVAQGASFSYQALTGFCRRHGIGQEPKQPTGQYHFEPAQEMQHDTSPHDIRLGGKVRRVQTASLVLCYSRILFFQVYPRFRRFECKVFLTKAFQYMGGACTTCMIDNTHVVVLKGTGASMIAVPEMDAFADRFGFEFRAHEVGDANRSGRVERPFSFIEGNFLAGREFTDWSDANERARAWCDQVNATYKKHIRAVPRHLWVTESPHLRRLPIWVPDPYELHHRIVDCEGYVCVETNRYSVPSALIGRRVEVRQTEERLHIYEGPREITCHERERDPVGRRITLPEHRPERRKASRAQPSAEEVDLLRLVPEIAPYVAALKGRGHGQSRLALRRLLTMAREYPREPLLSQIRTAAHYGLYDLDRLERMVLRAIATEYFRLPLDVPPPDQAEDSDDNTESPERGTRSTAQEPAPGPDGRDPT